MTAFRSSKEAYRKIQITSLTVAVLLAAASILLLLAAAKIRITKPGSQVSSPFPQSSAQPVPQSPGSYVTARGPDAGDKEMLRSAMKVNWVIWGAMLLSLGVYIFVAHLLKAELKTAAWKDLSLATLRTILFVIAFMEYPLIHYLRKKMVSGSEAGRRFRTASQTLPSRGHPANIQYTSALVVSLALAESMAIYGLVLFLLAKDMRSMYVLTAFSAVAMIIYRPKMEELETLASEIRRVGIVRARD